MWGGQLLFSAWKRRCIADAAHLELLELLLLLQTGAAITSRPAATPDVLGNRSGLLQARLAERRHVRNHIVPSTIERGGVYI